VDQRQNIYFTALERLPVFEPDEEDDYTMENMELLGILKMLEMVFSYILLSSIPICAGRRLLPAA
jgi:hypothetical protein